MRNTQSKRIFLVEISWKAKRGLQYYHSKCWQWDTSDCWPLRIGFWSSLAVCSFRHIAKGRLFRPRERVVGNLGTTHVRIGTPNFSALEDQRNAI